jgi:hypothetical protein
VKTVFSKLKKCVLYNSFMWICTKCERIFERANQPHSCNKVPLDEHFKNKDTEQNLFNTLVKQINEKVGECKIISLPCCIHLFGKYEFLAVLPKRDKLEIRFSLDRKLNSSRLKQAVPVSSKDYKNCFEVSSEGEIDDELIGWIKESYHLKNK